MQPIGNIERGQGQKKERGAKMIEEWYKKWKYIIELCKYCIHKTIKWIFLKGLNFQVKWYTNEVIRKGVRRQKEWKEMDLSPETSAY